MLTFTVLSTLAIVFRDRLRRWWRDIGRGELVTKADLACHKEDLT